jgi:DNA (cytosine-5)-methyltransferase 1
MMFGSLFSGCGSMDLACERAGMACRWQVENDRSCVVILERHFPDVRRYGDIIGVDAGALSRVDLVIGGDPCPSRSRGRNLHGSDSPDLWPEFLRVVSALRPLWVLREHVVAGDADDCWADLCNLGYDSLVLEADSAAVTGQSRPREYLCGVLESAGVCPGRVFSQPPRRRRSAAEDRRSGAVGACLTSSARRYDSSDDYLLEPGRGIRILVPEERERLQGLEPGWTAGLPDAARERLTGNAATVPVVQWMAGMIAQSNPLRRSKHDGP